MKHVDACLHVRGESQYMDDVNPPRNLLHAVVFGSPAAHGRIRRLDLDAARRAAGVAGVFTAADIPGSNLLGPIIQDERLLAVDEVAFIGQPMAIVVAESVELARKALALVRVEIDPLPVVTDPREAFRAGDLIAPPRTWTTGDVDANWGRCAVVVSGTCDVPGQEHVPLETNRARAIPKEDRQMLIHSSTQSPHSVQRAAARILGVPEHKVEVDVKRLGGGFGGKEDQATHWACMAAVAARALGQPVELVLNRLEDIRMTGKRHPYSSDFKIGLSREGDILCYEAWHYQNSGAFADLSVPVLERTLLHSTNAYRIPNVRVMAVCCRTHLPPNTAFRGFGGPQGVFVIECAIARAAEALGVLRDVIQSRNLLQDGDCFYYGQRLERCRSRATWDEAVRAFDLPSARRRITEYNARHAATKQGLAVMPICFGISFTKTFLNQGSALVHVYTDGSVMVASGGIEMGQGVSTNLVAIAARTFGISPERIKVESTNTTRVANMSASAASATTDLNGNATILAVNQILEGLHAVAARELGQVDAARVSIRDDVVQLDGRPTSLTWPALISKAYMSRTRLSAHGFYTTPAICFYNDRGQGTPFAYHSYGAALVSVTVDCLRGRYTIDSVKLVHDLGRPINELVDRGQIEGGLAQGLGWMTVEDLVTDAKGRNLSHALSTYKLPDAFTLPDDLQVNILEHQDNPPGPLGSKAVGEPPFLYGIGVFFALLDAMRAFAPDTAFDFHAPLTPERVLMQLYRDRPLKRPAGRPPAAGAHPQRTSP